MGRSGSLVVRLVGCVIMGVLVPVSHGLLDTGHESYEAVCQPVFDDFPYCLEFLTGSQKEPTSQCCKYIHALNQLAHTRYGWRRICGCIEAMVDGTTPPILYSYIEQLPLKCRTRLSFPISEHMDCSKGIRS